MPGAATSTLAADQGWLYELLRWAGVDPTTAAHWQDVVIKPFSVVVVVVVAALVGWLGNRVIRRWVGAVARKAVARADSPRAAARAATLTALTANVWRGVVGTIAFFVALGTIGVNLTPLLAGATVIGATLGFGAQSMVRDLLSGFLLTVEGQFDIGDTIVVGTTTGTVEDLTLRVTRLRAYDGTVYFVPNGEIRVLANGSRGSVRAAVDVPVPAASDVEVVLGAVRDGAADVTHDERYGPLCLDAPRLWGVIGSDADTFTTRVSVGTAVADRDTVTRALRRAVLVRLHSDGVFAPAGAEPAAGAPDPGPDGDDG